MLEFQPVEGFSSTNCLIEIKWGSGINVNAVSSYPDLAFFNCKTFASLYKDAASNINYAYGPVNGFLKKLDIKEQEIIANAFILMHLEIIQAPSSKVEKFQDKTDILKDVIELENKLAEIIDSLEEATNLCQVITDYIHTDVPISNMEGAGTKPQHSEEMTFSREEAIRITSLAIFMKFLSPIVGAFINKYKDVIPTNKKEEHSESLVLNLLKRKYENDYYKLYNYIKTLLSKSHKNDVAANYNGQTLESTTRMIIATIITKRFVGVNLYRDDGNIIRHISSTATKAQGAYQGGSTANSAKIIAVPRDRPDMEEGNSSNLETESSQSSRTADTPILIKIATLNHFNKTLKDENIDTKLVNRVIKFYNSNLINVSPMSLYLISCYVGSSISGGASVNLLKYPELVKIIALIQIILAKSGLHNLVHMLSFKISEVDREQNNNDFAFINSWKTQAEYSECKKLFPAGFGEKEWNSDFVLMTEFLIKKTLVYNTAPDIWNLINDEDIRNNKVYSNENYTELMSEFMNIIRILFSMGEDDVNID